MIADEQILLTFAQHEATTMATSLLLTESGSFSREEIAAALVRLERERTLLRYTWDGNDWLTLTLRGIAMRGGTATAGPPAPEIVFEHPHPFRGYSVYVLGSERGDGTWCGWLEFVPGDGERRLRTGQETSQPNRDALVYWASGLEDIYFDGALTRASG